MSQIRQDQEEEEEEEEEAAAAKTMNNRSPHHEYSRNYLVPMSNNYDHIKELTWENGQLSLSMLPKQTYGGDTLESVVRQGYNTTFKSFDEQNDNQESGKLLSSAGKWIPNPSSNQQVEVDEYSSMPTFSGGFDQKKRARISESEKLYREMKRYHHQQLVDDQRAPEISACASASAAFCREKDSTMMTWPSFESPRSLKTSRKGEDLDSACNDFSQENQDGERMTIEDDTAYRSQSSARRSRASAIHNQSERRRRDRINQKMKALQKLVPNASKTDKASMLDEVIQYLKQLQAQVQVMSNARMINQQQQQMMMMMMPPSTNNNGNTIQQQQQQFQMSLLSRMGMFDMARNMQNPFFTPSSFVLPPIINPNLSNIPLKINNAGNSAAVPTFNSNAYNAFLTQQSMNADFFNKMATLYGETANQMSKNQVTTLSQPNINGTHGR